MLSPLRLPGCRAPGEGGGSGVPSLLSQGPPCAFSPPLRTPRPASLSPAGSGSPPPSRRAPLPSAKLHFLGLFHLSGYSSASGLSGRRAAFSGASSSPSRAALHLRLPEKPARRPEGPPRSPAMLHPAPLGPGRHHHAARPPLSLLLPAAAPQEAAQPLTPTDPDRAGRPPAPPKPARLPACPAAHLPGCHRRAGPGRPARPPSSWYPSTCSELERDSDVLS